MKHLSILFIILLASCQANTSNNLEIPALEAETLKSKIDSLFAAEIKPDEPGAALLVSYNGEMIIGKGYGLRDTESGQPITPSTNMRMASVSKQFTALCILSLVDQGKLSVKDEAYQYLPYPIFKGISVEQLMNHTSGLPDYYMHLVNTWDRSKTMENRDVLEWLSTSPERLFEPGAQWQYSNTAYLMLALIVEEVSGQEFSQYAKEHVFEPAGMTNTNYFNLAQPIDIPERAFCYERDSLEGFRQVDGFFMNGVMGDGAVYTSLNDYFQYDAALRAKTILSDSMHELIFKPSSQVGDDETNGHYAMGWFIRKTEANHSGGWFGTNTFVKRHLDKPLTYAIFMNRNTMNETRLVQKVDSLLRAYIPKG